MKNFPAVAKKDPRKSKFMRSKEKELTKVLGMKRHMQILNQTNCNIYTPTLDEAVHEN